VSEQTYTVVGTAVSPKGVIKVRWTNDLITHYKRVHRKGCTDIDFHETPNPMTKLEALDWLIKNKELTEEQQEIIYIKKAEKARQRRLQHNKQKEEVK
jgi:hypothetical protein